VKSNVANCTPASRAPERGLQAQVAALLAGRVSKLGRPCAGSAFGDAIDWEVSQAWQDRAKVAANRDFYSSAGFDDREYRHDTESG
jgi:hypothetical protein